MDKELHLDYVRIGKRLKKERGKKTTQEQLAEIAGCSSNHISNIECGNGKVSLELLYRLCSILNLSMDYVVGGVKQSNGIPSDFNEMLCQLTDDQKDNLRALMTSMIEQNRKKRRR